MVDFAFAVAQRAIIGRFADLWNKRSIVEWPNDPLDDNLKNRPWVRLGIEWGGNNRITLSKPALYRVTGLVTVQVYTAADGGEGENMELCDAAAAIFGDVTMDAQGKIRFRAPTIDVLGNTGTWWQQNVTCAFTRDAVG